MKVRLGYVSNSSSSSYVVAADPKAVGILGVKLSKEHRARVLDEMVANASLEQGDYMERLEKLKKAKSVWLTEFLYNMSDEAYDWIHDKGLWYAAGQMDAEPYAEDTMMDLSDGQGPGVWIFRTKDEMLVRCDSRELLSKIKAQLGTSRYKLDLRDGKVVVYADED